MKLEILTLVMIFCSLCNITAQQASFETVFYFEDSVGNCDSIVVGFDDQAGFDYNPEFGEQEIETPFSDSFEVRAARPCDVGPCIQTKKIVTHTNPIVNHPTGCHSTGTFIFWIQAEHFPIIINWDSTFFIDYDCINMSFLTKDIFVMIFDEIGVPIEYESTIHSCLTNKTSWTISLNDDPENVPYSLEFVNSNGQLDTVYGIYMFYAPSFSDVQCDDRISSINDLQKTSNEVSVLIHPNPTRNFIQIDYDKDQLWQSLTIFDINGEVINDFNRQPAHVDLSSYPNGLYYLQFRSRTDKILKKIIKH